MEEEKGEEEEEVVKAGGAEEEPLEERAEEETTAEALELAALCGPAAATAAAAAREINAPLILGIDPDVSGALAIVRREKGSYTAEVVDVPAVKVRVGKRERRRHDAAAIAALLRGVEAPEGSVAFIEQCLPFPKDGKQGWYGAGYGYGMWMGALAGVGFHAIPVTSSAWKRHFGIYGREFSKDDSRTVAGSIFPSMAAQLKRKKDHGRAEALLIAAFGHGLQAPRPPPEQLVLAVPLSASEEAGSVPERDVVPACAASVTA